MVCWCLEQRRRHWLEQGRTPACCTPLVHRSTDALAWAPAPRRYEMYAFNRPDTLLARATYPLARFFQRKFRRDSAAAIAAAVAAGD